MNQFLEAALEYTRSGLAWKIFPLVPGQKIPITKHGVKDACSHPDVIRAWWKKWPTANIAVACGAGSGVYVVDVDVAASGDISGIESLKEFPLLPETVEQDTPRGGFHAFYKARHTNDPPANRNSFRPGIDVRGAGFYVVVAPSIHPNGGVYKWRKDCSPWDIQPAEFPDFMRPTTRSPWRASPELEREFGLLTDTPVTSPVGPADADVLSRARLYLTQCDAAIQGQAGHSKLLWAAVALVRGFKLPDDQALTLLEGEYNPRCIPPWDFSLDKDAKDFRRKIGEAHKVTPDKPDGWLLDDDAYKPVDPSQVMTQMEVVALLELEEAKKFTGNRDILTGLPPEQTKEATFNGVPLSYQDTLEDDSVHLLPPLPEGASPGLAHLHGWLADQTSPLNPPGLVGDICDWINDTAIRRQPFLSLACTLAFCGVLFGRKVRDHIGTRTNIYVLGVADSSAGKNHAQNQIRNLSDKAGCLSLIGGVNVTGDASIESKLSTSPSTLFLWDEIGFLLVHANSGQSKHHAGLIPFLMQLYSASGSVFLGREYADEEKQRKIIQPCCCLYGVSSPERFMPGLTPEQLLDGWLARCLVFRSKEIPKKTRKGRTAPPPEKVVELVNKWYERSIAGDEQGNLGSLVSFNRTGEGSAAAPSQILVPCTENSESIFIQFDDKCEARGKASGCFRSLWLKGEENARKIALIVASGVDFDRPKITTPIARYACCLVEFLLEDFCKVTAPKISTSQLDTQKQKILRIIDEKGIEGCTVRAITRSARWSSKKQREGILSDLVEAEEAVIAPSGKGVRYWTIDNYRKFLEKSK